MAKRQKANLEEDRIISLLNLSIDQMKFNQHQMVNSCSIVFHSIIIDYRRLLSHNHVCFHIELPYSLQEIFFNESLSNDSCVSFNILSANMWMKPEKFNSIDNDDENFLKRVTEFNFFLNQDQLQIFLERLKPVCC